MFTFKKVVCCLMAVSLLSLSSGCAPFKLGRLPGPDIKGYPNIVTQKDVSVAVKMIDPLETPGTFGCEMDSKKVDPVFIVIVNKGSDAYVFKKADVGSSYLSAEEVAKRCACSRIERVQDRLFHFGIVGLVITGIVTIPMSIADVINCPKRNDQMKKVYLKNEIVDTAIEPGTSINGLMFLASDRSGELFTIPLVNRGTGEKLLFQFNNFNFGAVNAVSKEEIKEKNKNEKGKSKEGKGKKGPKNLPFK